ncbi:MAG TPA: DNA polymerase ligase N-terminal domain-containing protein [Gemmatimonadaceae bacterium]|jgi:bifunctional non-homologous end joining protein LigD
MRRKDKSQLSLFEPHVRFGPERPILAYVVQKHRATRLHYDFRLQIRGVMKSWAIYEGPSIDPWSWRLAVEVRDHAKAHNQFEGVIPPGGNGAGPVMIWDRGTFAPTEDGPFDVEKLHDAYEDGTLPLVLYGKRLGGRWTLERRRNQYGYRSQWELRKHSDAFSDRRLEPVDEYLTSVVSGRTMAEIESTSEALHLAFKSPFFNSAASRDERSRA